MITDISLSALRKYVANQLNNYFPDDDIVDSEDVRFVEAFNKAIDRLEYCFSHITIPGYSTINSQGKEEPYFQHTNSDQYCQFLWFFSNSLFNIFPESKPICDKLILLNKTLHGCWYTYKVKLPDIFLLVHPVGSVIGHATYSNYLVVCQNVTIGERVGDTKKIGEYCFLATGATIMGDGEIGDNVSIGINTIVYKEDISNDTVVYIDKISGERKMVHTNKPSRAHFYFK